MVVDMPLPKPQLNQKSYLARVDSLAREGVFVSTHLVAVVCVVGDKVRCGGCGPFRI